MISTSKQDLHDFPDLSPPSAAQLLINAKDYANHRNHHCITSSRKERIKIESSSKIVMLSLDFMSSVCVDYFVFSTYSYIGPRATIPTDLWNCSNFHFLRVIGVDGQIWNLENRFEWKYLKAICLGEKKQEEGYKLLHDCVEKDSETTTYQQQKFRTNGEKFKHQNRHTKMGFGNTFMLDVARALYKRKHFVTNIGF